MQLHIMGKNIDVSAALKNFTTEKFNHLELRFNDITNVNVVYIVEHTEHVAEATVTFHGTEIHATAREDDMYKAIDSLIAKITIQITKHKDKLIESHHQK